MKQIGVKYFILFIDRHIYISCTRNHTTSRCFILIYNVKPEVDFSCKIG